MGAIVGRFLPAEGAGFWPLLSMGAILGGAMRSPFMGVALAIELTHDINMLLPLLVAAALAHAFFRCVWSFPFAHAARNSQINPPPRNNPDHSGRPSGRADTIRGMPSRNLNLTIGVRAQEKAS